MSVGVVNNVLIFIQLTDDFFLQISVLHSLIIHTFMPLNTQFQLLSDNKMINRFALSSLD